MPPAAQASTVRSVLHLSTRDDVGGSARSAMRIHRGLRAAGLTSRMLVAHRSGSDPDVQVLAESLPWHVADRVVGRASQALALQDLLMPSSFGLVRHPWFQSADVVQVYNTHGGFLSHAAFPLLSARRPVVWRLSDMWALTGHCAYAYDCERWRGGCGHCPHLDTYPALPRDTTALLWRVKRATYRRSRLHLVAPSRWLLGLVRESPLLRALPAHLVPNGVDTDVFHPRPRAAARQALGVPPEDDVVLFAAASTRDPRKGGALLAEALARLLRSRPWPLTLLTMGAGPLDWPVPPPHRAISLGEVRDEALLAIGYAAADLYVLPTLAENLPNTVLESHACGTPSVAFDVGGVGEVVRHGETGYLARAGDAADLARGMASLLDDPSGRAAMGANGRRHVEQEHSLDLEVRRLLDVYAQAVSERTSTAAAGAGAS